MKIRPTSVMTGNPQERPPIVLKRAPEGAHAAHPDPRTNPEDSAQFREDILRRYVAPFAPAWRHGGLNE
jgi:hypothetical protein